MLRDEFHARFATPGAVVLPVIHVLDTAQALRNAALCAGAGAPGVFLINHDFGVEQFLPIIRAVRAALPQQWLGVNFLAVTGRDAFPVLGELAREGCPLDAYWADDARIVEAAGAAGQTEADAITRTRERAGWDGLYFGGTAFKKQRPVAPADYGAAAALASAHMDVVTTSGSATGIAAELEKIAIFRRHCAGHALAVASGVTPDNARDYARLVDAILVATGIAAGGDFYNLDAAALRRLLDVCREEAAHD